MEKWDWGDGGYVVGMWEMLVGFPLQSVSWRKSKFARSSVDAGGEFEESVAGVELSWNLKSSSLKISLSVVENGELLFVPNKSSMLCRAKASSGAESRKGSMEDSLNGV